MCHLYAVRPTDIRIRIPQSVLYCARKRLELGCGAAIPSLDADTPGDAIGESLVHEAVVVVGRGGEESGNVEAN